MRKKDKKALLIIGIFAVFLAIFGGLFSVILADSFNLSVTSYVPRDGSVSNNKLIGDFNKEALFNIDIIDSYEENDVILEVIDSSGNFKQLYFQKYDWACRSYPDNHFLVNHPLSLTAKVVISEYKIELIDISDNSIIDYTTISQFKEPYKLNFIVTRERGVRCNNDGISIKNGKISVYDIILENYECLEDSDCTKTSGQSFFVLDQTQQEIGQCVNNVCVYEEETPEDPVEDEPEEESKVNSDIFQLLIGLGIGVIIIAIILGIYLWRKKK